MSIKIAQLQSRIEELEQAAVRVEELAEAHAQLKDVQPELQNRTQQWYRGARELLASNQFSGLNEFEDCYQHYREGGLGQKGRSRVRSDIEAFTSISANGPRGFGDVKSGMQMYKLFLEYFWKARSLVNACTEEIRSRELPVRSQLSFEVADDELSTAAELLRSAQDETLIRASGVIARVALERHLWTVLNAHNLAVQVNPPTKKRADTQDLLTTLVKGSIITPIQKSELDGLFAIANNCAHPKEVILKSDVERLSSRARELASVIL